MGAAVTEPSSGESLLELFLHSALDVILNWLAFQFNSLAFQRVCEASDILEEIPFLFRLKWFLLFLTKDPDTDIF